jgi:hypothetical protein
MTHNPASPKQHVLRSSMPAFAYGFLVVVAVLYVAPLVLLRMPGFQSWNMSQQSVEQDYVFTTPHIDADIVLIGESSAEFGVDPRQISAALGLKALNLTNTLQSLPVIGPIELDRYLSQNKRPRLLIFYLTPWDLDFFQSPLPRYEGEEMLLRYGSVWDIITYTWHHSTQMMNFPLQFYAYNTPFDPNRRHWPANTNKTIIQQLGHASLDADKSPLGPECAFPQHVLIQSGKTASMERILQEYQGSADQVVLYIAPVPRCAGYATFLVGPYDTLDAVPPQVLPADDFGDDGYYAHPIPSAVHAVTQQLIEALRQRLQNPAGGATPH